MSNVTSITTKLEANHLHAEGVKLWRMLDAERWTYRKLEARTGITKGVISSRMRGATPLTIEEIQIFAEVLGRNSVQLYSELITNDGDGAEQANLQPSD